MKRNNQAMFSETTFTLLQNEGYLMQGCFKFSLRELRRTSNAEPGQFYFAFFNYAIGLERLLKVILMLDQWHKERKFPTDDELKKYGGKSGHNLEMLHQSVHPLFHEYKIEWKTSWELDAINKDFLAFLASFANGNRYFNLAQLAGATKNHRENPIYQWQRLFHRVYKQDYPKAEKTPTRPDVPEDAMSDSELWSHHVIMAAASSHVCWRLVQFLIPLKALLIAIREQIQKDDFIRGGPDTDISVPFMEEFLDFVCEDKTIILEDEDWP
jgi:hypothetical protein